MITFTAQVIINTTNNNFAAVACDLIPCFF